MKSLSPISLVTLPSHGILTCCSAWACSNFFLSLNTHFNSCFSCLHSDSRRLHSEIYEKKTKSINKWMKRSYKRFFTNMKFLFCYYVTAVNVYYYKNVYKIHWMALYLSFQPTLANLVFLISGFEWHSLSWAFTKWFPHGILIRVLCGNWKKERNPREHISLTWRLNPK